MENPLRRWISQFGQHIKISQANPPSQINFYNFSSKSSSTMTSKFSIIDKILRQQAWHPFPSCKRKGSSCGLEHHGLLSLATVLLEYCYFFRECLCKYYTSYCCGIGSPWLYLQEQCIFSSSLSWFPPYFIKLDNAILIFKSLGLWFNLCWACYGGVLALALSWPFYILRQVVFYGYVLLFCSQVI